MTAARRPKPRSAAKPRAKAAAPERRPEGPADAPAAHLAEPELFLAAPPGLEAVLAEEARALGFAEPEPQPGGVRVRGGLDEGRRANLRLRGAGRVLLRVASFRALHLAQLDKRARRLPWGEWLRSDLPVRVEATCRRSRIYHAGAAAQRVETAIAETLGAPIRRGASAQDADPADTAALRVMIRMEDDLCAISLDLSGEPLHRRGLKLAVAKAPMRETLAALFLRQCGYDGTEPVLDPMCGSGTFVLEAAEIAAGLAPGRARHFAFEDLAGFDPEIWAQEKAEAAKASRPAPESPRFLGFDRDQGAIRMSGENAARAGLDAWTRFEMRPVSALTRPEGPPGLVMVNPPYGARIGEKGPLRGLHGALGKALREQFGGWRVGLVTSEPDLARATGLPFLPPGPPIPHGGLKIRLYRTDPLP